MKRVFKLLRAWLVQCGAPVRCAWLGHRSNTQIKDWKMKLMRWHRRQSEVVQGRREW